MFVINCLPFSRGLKKESLSYFSSSDIPKGSLIKVGVRGKKVPALVVDSRSARDMKAEIRSFDFQLKKVFSFAHEPFLPKEFLDAIRDTSVFFATTEGALLSAIIPAPILENPNLLRLTKNRNKISGDVPSKETPPFKNVARIEAVQTEDEERFLHYKSLIREEFAKNKSVFFCLPQNEHVAKTKDELERGIETFVSAFHRDMSKAVLRSSLEKASDLSHPVAIIGTARWLSIGRPDISTIIIEKESGSGWQTLQRPFVDLRYFAERFAFYSGSRIIFGDSLLRLDTLHRNKNGEVGNFENVKWRMPGDTENKLLDLKKSLKKKEEFRAVSEDVLQLIEKNSARGSHTFVFAARKGLAPLTLCRDCGEEVRCLNCSSPMVLYHRKKSSQDGPVGIFRCHQCGETRDATEYCRNCGSWKLASFGSGADRVASEIREYVDKSPVYELNRDIATTPNKAQRIVDNFYEERGAILIGTEMAFPYMKKKVGVSIIASFDSLFSIPDFRINEKIFKIILETRNLAKRKFLVQSRDPKNQIIEWAMTGNIAAFYEQEIRDRKILGYPPFGAFIKITARGTKSVVEREVAKLSKILEDARSGPSKEKLDLTIFGSIHEKKGGQAATNAVIKLPSDEYPDADILNVLRSLPPHFEIKVNPDSLL